MSYFLLQNLAQDKNAPDDMYLKGSRSFEYEKISNTSLYN